MTEIKRLPINEFRDIGFLQEANRQFFHPHGLALETTRIRETREGEPELPLRTITLGAQEYELLRQLLDGDADRDCDETYRSLMERVDGAETYEVGATYLSGVWDYRDDPEGMFFGDLGGHAGAAAKASRVAEERRRHFSTRLGLLRPDLDAGCPYVVPGPDVEPLDWTYPERTEAS